MPGDLVTERRYRSGVTRHSVVSHMPTQDTSQPPTLHRNGFMPTTFQLLIERFQLHPQPFGDGDTFDPEPPGPALRADMREPQEIKRLRLTQTPPLAISCGVPPELDQPRLARMQPQPEPRQPPAKLNQEPPRIILTLKPDNKIVSKAHNNHLTARMVTTPPLDPQVQNIVQVDIRQQRRY